MAQRRRGREGGGASDVGPGPAVNPQERARAICLRLLAVRPRTRAELATALRRREVPQQAADAVLERFSEVGMIDDTAFAQAWVTSRHHGRGLARGALASELRRRGVENSTVSEALDQLDPETEQETALALVRRRLPSLSGVPAEVVFRKLLGMLARRGYPRGLSVRVVRSALTEDSDVGAVDMGLEAIADALDVDDAGC